MRRRKQHVKDSRRGEQQRNVENKKLGKTSNPKRCVYALSPLSSLPPFLFLSHCFEFEEDVENKELGEAPKPVRCVHALSPIPSIPLSLFICLYL